MGIELKMLSSKGITTLLVGLIIVLPTVICLQCYICDQQNDDYCRSNVKEYMIRVCEMKPYGLNGTMVDATGCTVLLSTQRDPAGPTSIRRACFYRKDFTNPLGKDGCHSIVESIYKPHDCKICEGDLCNSSSLLSSSATIILLTTLITYFILF